jgi:hypothetical protein
MPTNTPRKATTKKLAAKPVIKHSVNLPKKAKVASKVIANDDVPEHRRELKRRSRPAQIIEEYDENGKPRYRFEHSFHTETIRWWETIVVSPMTTEYETSDWEGLYRLAHMVDDQWWTGDAKLLPEIRQQSSLFGLAPLDRHKLKWEINRTAAAKTNRQAAGAVPVAGVSVPATKPNAADPRLRLVK